MKAALYLRVSSKEQHTENQLLPLEQFCKQRGFEVVNVHAENESAWQAGHQHEWARLMHDAESRRFTVVVVWALDRVTRQGVSSLFLQIQALRRNNVGLVSVQEQWLEGLGEFSELFVSMCGFIASFESRRRSERTKAGLARALKNGSKLGRPFGSKDKIRRKRGGYFNRYANKPSVKIRVIPTITDQG
jgi:DNA invertase Pin-like site-specific DNA recombinase